jgi:FkbM family methyltransferase
MDIVCSPGRAPSTLTTVFTKEEKYLNVPPAAYHVEKRIVHVGNIRESEGVLTVETSAKQWAYAVELPLERNAVSDGQRLRVKIGVCVESGCIGFAVALRDGSAFHEEIQVPSTEGQWSEIEFVTPTVKDIGSLIIRNTSARGPSRGKLRILDVVDTASCGDVPQKITDVDIDVELFRTFGSHWSGITPAGFTTNWTGAITRGDFEVWPPEILAVINRERREDIGPPFEAELILDWGPLLQAVADAKGIFRMAALGAGWGRWLTGGAFLARKRGLDYRVLGVEAEPQHFAWMKQHMDDNRIPPEKRILLNAAAAGSPGFCWFETGDSQNWYGQQIRSYDDRRENLAINRGSLQRIETVTIEDVVARLSPIDYLHMDIQSAELDFLSYKPDLLNRHDRMINIGTHTAEIEMELRKLLKPRGWTMTYDLPGAAFVRLRGNGKVFSTIHLEDGVQVWVNRGI